MKLNNIATMVQSIQLLLNSSQVHLCKLNRSRLFTLGKPNFSTAQVMASEQGINNNRLVTSWPKVILFGDSITQFSFSSDGCWGSLLAEHLQRKCDIITRGFSGYNTRWCNIILPKVFSEFDSSDIALVTIFLGANDSNLPTNTHQHVPLSEYREHLVNMVQKLQNHGIARDKIILISPPSCDENTWKQDCIENDRTFTKCNKEAGKYAAVCVDVSKECGTGCVDLYSEMMKQEDWEKLLNDGLHLSPSGSKLLFQLLKPLVDKATSHLPMVFPDFHIIDNSNPNATLE